MILSAALVFASGSAESDEEIVLRVGSSSIGPDNMNVFMDSVAEFEAQNPGVTVEWDSSSGDDYQFAGLPALLESDNPPDLFFEWGGNRVHNHALDGYAMEVSDLAAEFRGDFAPSAWSGFEFDDGVYGIPLNQDITIQMWYDTAVFDELGLDVPETWDEFMDVCEAIVDSGRTPIVMGNADAWVAGNFAGLFLYRIAGNEKAEAIMGLEEGYRLDDPDFVRALELAYEMGERGYVNADMNTLGYEESFVRMFDGSAVMYPLGSWYPSEVEYIGMDFDETGHDYFMVPPIEGGKGDQTSILGLNTGYVVNAQTEHKDLVYELVRVMFNREYQERHSREGGGMVVNEDANAVDSRIVAKMVEDLATAGSIVAPPDTGYNLEMAFALYEAIARVFENEATPSVALAEAEAKIQHLRGQ
jgi:ABC-type glycerol-3-phosphate transport system substrate-binding protein